MALSKLAANSFDLTDNYALTGTVTGVTSTQKIFLIKNIDASSDSAISFVNGSSSVVLDNTYKTYLFNPSSTTFVKHFISETGSMFANARAWHNFVAGYCNTTSAIDAVRFKFDTGNIDTGRIALYGIK